jgi:predicted phage terminase large subunit-like protein
MDLSKLDTLTPEEQAEVLALVKEAETLERLEGGRNSFGAYVKHIWPQFIEGRHHQIIEDKFDRVIQGKCKRLIINLPPRHTKSEFASWLLPSYYLGHFPERKVIQASHTADFATGFGRRVRNLVATPEYQELFPNTHLVQDAKAAGRWATSANGEYFAIGVGGKLAGKGADLLIIDDPHSEQDYIQALKGDVEVFNKTYEWYTSGPRQRLQPGAAIVIVMTRWHKRDVTGRITQRMVQDAGIDDWEIIEFPALMPDTDAPLWPEFWPYEELTATRAELPAAQWNAQYLQNPTAEEGALIKREWWKIWDKPQAPECDYIIQTWDTAYLKTQRHDYNACTTWGIFYQPDDTGVDRANIILLDAFKKRMEFPELKKEAYERYQERTPDNLIIEAKASGWPLIFELRQMGVPVSDYTPVRGTKANPNDKISRVNGITDIFSSGMVWRPDTRWAEDVAEECAEFPFGDHDDLVDSMWLAINRFREGGFLRLSTDEPDEPHYRRTADYY